MVRPQLLDQRQQADHQSASTYQKDAEDEDDANEETKVLKNRENESVGASFKLFFRGERQHHLRARFSDQVRNGNELVALCAKRVDNLRQRGKGLAAVAAAVVQKNNIAFVLLLEDAVNNFFSGDRLAVPKAPVIRIDALADNQVSELLGIGKLGHFLGIFRLVIDAVRRAEENRLYSERAFNQALRQIQLPADFRARNVVELWMREGVISNFVAFGVLALENIRPLVGHVADHEEYSGYVLLLQNVQNLRGPLRIGTIIKGKGDFFICGAELVDVEGERDDVVGFVGEKVRCCVVFEGAPAVLGSVGNMPEVAVALEDQVGAGRKVGQFLPGCIVGVRGIPNRPERGVRGSQPP